MNLTENKVAEIKTAELTTRAEAIRDAVVTKSVTAEMVGSMFVDLITACGNVRDALALFLDTNVTEIITDIDTRLSGIDAATQEARAEIQKSETTRALVENLVSLLSSQNVSAPTQLTITNYPETVTFGNMQNPAISAHVIPSFGFGSILFLADNKVIEITPDGHITPLALGTGKVQVVSSVNTSVYKTLTIAVVPPRIRLASIDKMRLDKQGNIRLT